MLRIITLLCMALCSLGAGCSTVYVIGDSLAMQSQFYYVPLLEAAGWNVEANGLPGLSTCDFVPRVKARLLQTPKPSAIVLETEGLTGGAPYTLCMVDANGNTLQHGTVAYDLKIYSDLREMFLAAQSAAVRMIFVGGIPIIPLSGAAADQYRNMSTASIAAAGLPAVTVSHRVIERLTGPGEAFRLYLPCNAEDISHGACLLDGTAQVRSMDGVHFDPLCYRDPQDVYHDCDTYSPGAARMGRAIYELVVGIP